MGRKRAFACWRIPASGTSLITTAISAGIMPEAQASEIDTIFEPLPEPRMPNRNGSVRFTALSYRKIGCLSCWTFLDSAGAALDVLSTEPPAADNPLLSAPRCLITPHLAWAARASRQRLMDAVVENVRAFLAGTPVHVVNGVA